VDLRALVANLNAAMNERFSTSDKTVRYVLSTGDMPYLNLDRRVFEAMKIDEKTAEEALQAAIPEAVAKLAPPPATGVATHRLAPSPIVVGAYSKWQFDHGELPSGEWGTELAHSYVSHGNWFVLLALAGYQMQDLHSPGTTHFSPWSYDRHVPLAFYGSPFQPGTYRGRVEPVDMAVTFASLLGVNFPSAAVGHVRTEALRGDGRK
jgi:hypothetical protein